MAGDIFLLGNTSWRIRRVEAGACASRTPRRAADDSVLARRGPGAHARAVAPRSAALREEIVDGGRARRGSRLPALLVDVRARRARRRAAARLRRAGARGARRRADADPVVAERFFDEAGGMQLVIHAPFGGRINRAWGLALRKRFCRTFDFELQAAATDDGIVLSLGQQHSFPLETVFEMSARRRRRGGADAGGAAGADVRDALALERDARAGGAALPRRQARAAAAAAHARRRICSRRCSPRRRPARTTTAAAQSSCPITRWCARRCATACPRRWTSTGSRACSSALATGEIADVGARHARAVAVPHEILNANPYTFLDDAPLEERRARAVAVRRGAARPSARALGGARPGGDRRGGRRGAARSRATPTSCTICCSTWARCPRRSARRAAGTICSPRWSPRRRAAPPRGRAASTGSRPSGARSPPRCGPERRFVPDVVEPPSRRAPRLADARERAGRDRARSRRRRWDRRRRERRARGCGCGRRDVEVALARLETDGAVLRGRFLTATLSDGDAVVRAAPARAHPSAHARRAAPRDRAGERRRLPALPVRLAARRARARQLHGRRAWRA